jgi:hypothetical protein
MARGMAFDQPLFTQTMSTAIAARPRPTAAAQNRCRATTLRKWLTRNAPLIGGRLRLRATIHRGEPLEMARAMEP